MLDTTEEQKIRELHKTLFYDLAAERTRKAKERDEHKAREKAELIKNMIHVFSKGKRYSIYDSPGANLDNFNPTTGAGCIFLYLRKDGKHHIFREERGGWTRTYTDVQLMGKTIREV